MRSNVLASAALFLGLLVAGCSASAAPAGASSASDLAGASPETATAACETVQHIPYASNAQVDAAIASFTARNVGTWKIDHLSGVDGIQAAIRTAIRTDRDEATTLPAGAESIARAFMEKNKDLLHFTPAGMATAQFFVSSVDGPSAVTLAYSGVRAGTEAFGQSVSDVIHLELWLADDGSVVKMQSFSSTNPDNITVCLTPPAKPIVDAILGTDLVYHKPEYVQVTPPKDVGPVEASDIGEAEPILYGIGLETEQQLIVAWRVTVTRGGHAWSFVVDTTGKVQSIEQQG